jgi:hypothetical protein
MSTPLYKFPVSLSIYLSTLLFTFLSVELQAQYVPPDYYGDPYHPGIAMVPNRGQVRSMAGGPATRVVAYTTGTVPQVYMMKETLMRLVWRDMDTIATTVDTVYAMDVSLLNSVKKDPIQVVQKDFHYNFYLPHCPPGGVEFVEGYSRTIYEDVYEGIDMHIYSGSLGMKMAFVIHPGADPADLRLKFTGLDSLRYGMLGSIKAMLKDKYIQLPEAVAYQVDVNDNIIPVGWTADYQVDSVSSVAGFICPAYDELKPLVLQIGLPPLGLGGDVEGVCWSTYWNGEDRSTPGDVVFVPGGTDTEGDPVADAQYYTGTSFSAFADFPHFNGELYAPLNPASTIYLSKFEDNRARWTNYHGISAGTHTVHGLTPCGNFGVAIGGLTQGTGMEEFGPPESFLGTGSAPGYIARFDHGSELLWCSRFHNITDMAYEPGRLVVVGQVPTPGPFFTPVQQPPGSAWFPPVLPAGGASISDAYVAVFDDLNRLRWSTRVGGSLGEDHARVAIHQGRIAMAGATSSADFPAILDGGPLAFDQSTHSPGPGSDLYLLRFAQSFALEWGTFIGASGVSENPTFNKGVAIKPQSGNVMLLTTGGAATAPYLPGVNWSTPPPPAGEIAGMLMEFDGSTKQLVYSTFLEEGSENDFAPYCVAVSEHDDVFVSGMMGDVASVTFDATPRPGFYFDPTGFGTRDGFLLWIGPERNLRWYTRFGGASGTSLEDVRTVAIAKGTLYTTGVTRADFCQGQFFPLVDPGPPAYFSPIGNQQNSTFIATFCNVLPSVSVPDAHVVAPFTIATTAENTVLITGLPEGQHPYAFYDTQGRLVAQGQVRAAVGEVRLPLPEVVSALYVLRIGGHAAQVLQLPLR